MTTLFEMKIIILIINMLNCIPNSKYSFNNNYYYYWNIFYLCSAKNNNENILILINPFFIFVGGLMILFIYHTSLVSNELIKWNLNTTLMFVMTIVALLLMLPFKWNFFFIKKNNLNILPPPPPVYSYNIPGNQERNICVKF